MCCLVQHTDTLCTISHDPGNDRAVKRIRRQRKTRRETCIFFSGIRYFYRQPCGYGESCGSSYTILSDGSSIKTTEMLALNILNTFYGQNANSRGTAQAKAVLFFILVASIGLLQLRSNRKKEVQQ